MKVNSKKKGTVTYVEIAGWCPAPLSDYMKGSRS
jgi:hypothetical protein